MGHLRPEERQQLQAALKAVDEEEARTARLYAAGKITESIWDSLWLEWQDRRNQIRSRLESLQHQHETHITNLDAALEMITRVSLVYNSLDRSDQKDLLRHIVSRVVIDHKGTISLELHPPFSYLKDVSDTFETALKQMKISRGKRKPVKKTPPVTPKRHVRLPPDQAGEVGFEPTVGGSKGRCLTTWRLPNATPIIPESFFETSP